ncbi:hypothetical protein ABIB25_002665 [Nakamurella sp. UYEF19]
MSRITNAIRSNREISRNRREIGRAIERAATPAMRDEIILMAQRQGYTR